MRTIISSGVAEYDETEFYLNFLHNMRAELTVIGGYSSLLLEENYTNLTDEQKEYIGEIKKSYISQINLVNDVTDLIRINTQTVTVHKRDFDMRDSINHAIEDLRELLNAKVITLELNLLPQPMYINGDDELIYKAFHHTLAQTIELLAMGSVIKINTGAREKNWDVTILDNGLGTPPDEILNLFKPFSSSAFFANLGKKEMSLNFIIAKKVIALHNGKLWVTSNPGFGTTVHIELPIRKEAEKKKILIIEDNLVIARMWEVKLKKDFEVILAGSGREGVELAKINLPDLIVLDILMPGMDGFETCKQIKEIPALRDAPIIFLSNIIKERMTEKAKELGAVDFLSKSTIVPTQLAEKIKSYLVPDGAGEESESYSD